jgi:subtilase family serine protease
MRLVLRCMATLLVGAVPLLCGAGATRVPVMSPHLVVGPRAIPVSLPGDAMFSCQLPGAPVACYVPSQILTAYNIQPLLDQGFTGTGKTIVIVDAFSPPTIEKDLDVFNRVFGLPAMNAGGPTFTIVKPDGVPPFDPNDPDQVGWSGEISLDVEWAHAIAPGANIVLVLAKSDEDADMLSATKYAVDHRLGDVISQSFGENESCLDPSLAKQQHQVFVEATLKNITLLASSGDDGAAQLTCDGNSFVQAVSSPADDPLVVAVGGTHLSAALDGTYQGETVWNDEFGASGGGYSVLFNKPFYQLAAVRGKKRGVPDVAYNGDVNGGVLTAWSQGDPSQVGEIFIFGGTSAGSPQWAGLVALADQRAGFDLGFISQGLYGMQLIPSVRSASFHDVTSGNNSVSLSDANGNPVNIAGYSAGIGWDATTGLGSPNGITFVDNLIRFTSPLDGFIGIIESGPLSTAHVSHAGRNRPH